MNDKPDMKDWEDQVNALLDGDLSDAQAESLKAAAEEDRALARAIIEAYQLQQVMAAIPQERAPASLRRKLKQVPRMQKALNRPTWAQPQWVAAMAVIPLVVIIAISQMGTKEPTEAEIVQARQDLALAFAYVGMASRKAGLQLESTVETGLAEPVTKSTIGTLNEQLDLNKEQEA